MFSTSKIDYGLNGNVLKIIAAITMLIDHVGVILLPSIIGLRVIGRISFPIFAFMIAEGCAHTKNKLKYFLMIFILGVGCQTALHIAKGPEKLNVLISFSVAVIGIYILQHMKNTVFSAENTVFAKIISIFLFIFTIVGIYFLNKAVRIDYGFWGCILPISASFLKAPTTSKAAVFKSLDNKFLQLLLFGICLLFMSLKYRGIQFYSLFAIIFLLFYSGRRGKLNMKYFFYVFYPVHLVLLEAIAYIVS